MLDHNTSSYQHLKRLSYLCDFNDYMFTKQTPKNGKRNPIYADEMADIN